MSNVENVRNLENIFFVKKGTVIENPNPLFKNSINTITVKSFKSCIELYLTDLNPNKIVVVEYENVEGLEDVILYAKYLNRFSYLKNMAIITDDKNYIEIENLPKFFNSIKKIKLNDLENHFNKLFDIYTEVLVLAGDIAKKINNQIREIISNSLADKEETYILIEKIAYLQEVRYYLTELSLTYDNISNSFDTADLLASYLVSMIMNGVDEDEIASVIIDEYQSFEFYEGAREDINEGIKNVIINLNER